MNADFNALQKSLQTDVRADYESKTNSGRGPHVEFKKRVPHAIGLIRTGDTVQYANLVLESA